MKSIEAQQGDRPGLDSLDLARIARVISGRTRLQCAKCQNWIKLTVQTRELRMGSSPNLAAIDPSQPGRPRLVLYCCFCQRIMGFVEGDEWADDEEVAADADGPTRWNHLEIEENDPGRR